MDNVKPENARTLEELRLWSARHDESCRLKWEHADEQTAAVKSFGERLTKLEKRVLVLATLAAAGGGVAGQIIAKLFAGGG